MPIIGVDTYAIPSQAHDSLTITVALFVGPQNDVACYRGHGSPEWVCAHGDRLTFDDAVKHFPHLERELAERGRTYGGRRFYLPYPSSEDDPDVVGY